MDWSKIVIHHSASPVAVRRKGGLIPVDAALIREWHLAKGWSDIGYHFVILPDGSCQEGRPLYRPGAHCKAGQRNFIGIGICLIGDFCKNEVPKSQLEGLLDKVELLMGAYHMDEEDIELHCNVPGAATQCPGEYFPGHLFFGQLHERLH